MALTKITSTNIQPGAIESSSLETSGATAGTYGSASLIPVLSVNAQGIVYAISETTVAGVTNFSYNSGTEVLTISTADGGSFTADVSSLASQTYVDTALANLIDSAPGALDTLNELAAAIGDDANFAASVTNSLATKVDKINITGATVGSSTQIPVITYNAQGQITSTTTTAVAGIDSVTFTNGTLTIAAGDGTNYTTDFDARYFTETEANSNFLGINAKAADSDLLDGLNSTQFLRSDAGVSIDSNGSLRLLSGTNGNQLQFWDTSGVAERARIGINSSNGLDFTVGTTTPPSATITTAGDLLVGTTNTDVGGSVTGIRLRSNGAILTSIDETGFYDTTIYADRRGTNNAGNILSLALGGYWKSSIGVLGTSHPANDGGITFNTVYGNNTLVEQMRITPSSVGIGTPDPSYKLDIDGGSSSTRLRVSTTNTGSHAAGIILSNSSKTAFNDGIEIAHGGGFTDFRDLAGESQFMIDMSNSRIGIGTTGPSYKLDIDGNNYNGATGTSIRIKDHSSNVNDGDIQSSIIFTGRYWSGDDNTAVESKIAGLKGAPNGNTGSALGFFTQTFGLGGSEERVRIDNAGNVGIGITDPNAKLHVIPGASSDTVPGVKVEKDWGSLNGAMVYLDGNPNSAGDGNVLLVKGGGTRSDTKTFEVRNGNGTTFAVFGSGEIQTGTKLLANPAYGGGAFSVINSTVDKNLYMPSFYGSGNVNLTYRHCFNISSDHFAVQFTGGGGNTVFTTYAIISGSHYRDILVQSYSLFYSHLKIKIIQDGGSAKSIWVAGNSYANNLYFLEWRVFPIKACPIEMNPSSSQSEFYHVHYASAGIVSSSSDDMPTGTGPSAW